ncbi:MAG: hypothetical protein IKE94_05445 [Aeriscardovia sp.]|nr:hypothetical protein [Aeriscardovia sp.]
MAIIQEHFWVNEVDFVRSYSDKGVKIHGGSPEGDYDVAEEPASLGRTYTETDIPIDDDVTAEEALSILLGGAV